ncbi:MAG: LysM domain-containing protein [Candidatus Omnitrophota bacterium]|jgi:LysM repeat protein|nr:MAG: LysM domain-containing protein [Candidatus Omnitrophota bacterium]
MLNPTVRELLDTVLPVHGLDYQVKNGTIVIAKRTEETFKLYTVQRGDTLAAIAQKYSVSVDDLKIHNPELTDPSGLSVGQKLRIP